MSQLSGYAACKAGTPQAVLVRREGCRVHTNRIYRLYREKGLVIHTRKRKKLAGQPQVPVSQAQARNWRWSMDFMMDRFANGLSDLLQVGRSLTAPKVVAGELQSPVSPQLASRPDAARFCPRERGKTNRKE